MAWAANPEVAWSAHKRNSITFAKTSGNFICCRYDTSVGNVGAKI